jgi:16S rRNA (uracil1498-N3)-methyltransferase
MTRRYYHPDLPAEGGCLQLSEPEFQHAVRVMRVQLGDQIELFDGKGHQASAIVNKITRRQLECSAESRQAVDREPNRLLRLGIALPKPDRARELIERLTELGVQSVTPLITSRTQRSPSASLLERLRRGSIEACKQSGRNRLICIDQPINAAAFFANSYTGATRWIADQSGPAIGDLIDLAGNDLVAAIGPEGGWTSEELACAGDSGFQLVGFGKRILRVETAATFLASRLLD